MRSIAIATLPGPWGPYHVAATERGVVAADWGVARGTFETALERRLGPLTAKPGALAVLEAAIPALQRIADGHPAAPAEVALDLTDRPAFDQRVLRAVCRIPWGRTASYGEIARQVGAPRAARAVGGAVGRNPIALVIPCHRVIAADGTLGGYGGDGPGERAEALERKRELLLREGVTIGRRGG
jgi:AraC family transcriptional regulator of adaptative response/methylated-DNA-[protein]-cysteine methyltransferase